MYIYDYLFFSFLSFFSFIFLFYFFCEQLFKYNKRLLHISNSLPDKCNYLFTARE